MGMLLKAHWSHLACALLALLAIVAQSASSTEPASATPVYIKLEAEDFGGIRETPDNEHWAYRMAWYPQWSRGGDSSWWAVAAPPTARDAQIGIDSFVPRSGEYVLWVRYEDYTEQPEPFRVVVKQGNAQSVAEFGQRDVVGSREAPFAWSYAWAAKTLRLTKGTATVSLFVAREAAVRRAVDAIVLTTDTSWRPEARGFPPFAYAKYLDEWAKTRRSLAPLIPPPQLPIKVPAAWDLPKTAGRDFWFLGANEMLGDVPIPVNVRKAGTTIENFVERWRKTPTEIPIFSSPACALQLGIGRVKQLLDPADPIRKYILENNRPFTIVGNYGSAGKIPDSYDKLAKTFGPLWVGTISGEGSYLGLPLRPPQVSPSTDLNLANYEWLIGGGGRSIWRDAVSKDWATQINDPMPKFILCTSVLTLSNVHRLAEAGSEVLGMETAAALPYTQGRIAFIRGAARQYGRRWLWYYGASFGDAIRTFTKEDPYSLSLEGLHVEERNATIGPSLLHIRRVLLNAYLQGATFVFPEQGYNLFDEQGELNPMGWAYDEMIRLATRHPDRGIPYTPIAVLLDKAHGWEKYDYQGMHVWQTKPLDRADRMIDGFFNVAYYPFPRNEGEPADDLNVPWPNGYFGDVFDVLVTSATRREAIRSYPVVFCVGGLHFDAAWIETLQQYVRDGGTLVVNVEQAAGLSEQFLGAEITAQTKETSTVEALPDGEKIAGTIFPYRLAVPGSDSRVIARTESGDAIALVHPFGKGRVVLATPSYLLGYDAQPIPYFARLLLQVRSGLLPVEVEGDCEYHVNLHPKGYLITVSNNGGIRKLSHSPALLDPAKVVHVSLRVKEKPVRAEEWLSETQMPYSFPAEWSPRYLQVTRIEWSQGNEYQTALNLGPGEIRVILIHTR